MNASIGVENSTNTTTSRNGLISSLSKEDGGLSGKPLFSMSNKIISRLYRELGATMPIIGVGGIFNAEDALQKIKAGATAVQIYTGLIYQGPGLVKQIKKGLVRLLEQDGFKNISDAIGVDAVQS